MSRDPIADCADTRVAPDPRVASCDMARTYSEYFPLQDTGLHGCLTVAFFERTRAQQMIDADRSIDIHPIVDEPQGVHVRMLVGNSWLDIDSAPNVITDAVREINHYLLDEYSEEIRERTIDEVEA